MNKVLLDTNILIYVLDNPNTFKFKIAENLLIDYPMISCQIVSEFINVAKRKLDLPKIEVLNRCNIILNELEIISFSKKALKKSEQLIKKYDFQISDAIIVATALETGCKVLYTEDMQHNLLVDKKLKILNPFIENSSLSYNLA